MSFAHLHVHTEYSLLDGSNKIKEYVARVKELGMNSAAITDHGVMYGVIDFYREAKKAGIKPILGCEVYVATGSRHDKSPTESADRYHHLVLLAENQKGYQNLIKLVSKGFVEGYYYKPRVDLELLETYHEGIIALSACLAGEVQRLLSRNMYAGAKEAALRYEKIFGKGNFFLELQDHGLSEQQLVNQHLMRLSSDTGIELVATNDVHYTYADDWKAHDILLCIQTGKKLTDENRMRYEGGQYFVKSEDEMRKLFPYAQSAIDNTQKIAGRCNVEIEFGVTKLPRYDLPQGLTSLEYLDKLCREGLRRRYGNPDEEIIKRLDYELGVIKDMGYVDYFLIVWDFINYAHTHGISVGPGRGSAAGSIVSYCLGITNIDPIKYNLLFERFLNPERVSMPDIDIDFCYERRQEVIDYVIRKYGSENVAQIVTFGKLLARAVIRDVGRVMDLPYALVDSIAKMIPAEPNMTLDRAMEESGELRGMYEDNGQIHELIDMAKKLEGLPRHSSTHAAGVVICREAVDEYVPLCLGTDGSVNTQFVMTTLEELGLLKMDFLGLRTLTVIRDAIRMTEKNTGEKIDIDHLDFADKAVLDYIGTGKTDGIFQLESAGMKNFMKELKPHSLEDVIAGIALYRPGPMDFIPQYIKGKNDPSSIRYDCPQMEPILKETYGCIVYQEQVMQTVRDLAGYTLGRSDLLRRAMSKKKADVMQKERRNFVYGNEEENIPGCMANGIDEATANKIYDEMTDFAKYAFNKPHAAAYAVVSYQTAYLKYYHPVEFMAALMTSVIDNADKVAEYIYSCRQMGIRILPPDINEGVAGFSVRGHDIRYGLAAIKSVGRPVIEAIVKEREKGGTFRNIKDFIERLSGKEVNKRTVESFIKAGALDSLGATRRQLMMIYLDILDQVTQEKKYSMSGQVSLFDMADEEQKGEFEISLPPVGEYGKETMLAFEKEVLGIYVSGHPLEKYEAKWKANITATARDFQADEDTGRAKIQDGERVVTGGIITSKTVKQTKTNRTMAFFTLEDLLGTVEVLVFPKDYEKNLTYIEEDAKVFVKGRADTDGDGAGKLICEKIIPFDEVPCELWIRFDDIGSYKEKENEIPGMFAGADGRDNVVIYLAKEKQIKRLPIRCNAYEDDGLIRTLKECFGAGSVKIVEKQAKRV